MLTKNISKTFILILLSTFFIFLSFNTVSTFAADPMVAVLPVREGSIDMYGFNDDEILNGITQDLTNKLAQKDNIRVIERSRIEEVLTEQNFGQSGRLDSATTSELGEILGVEQLIAVTVTQMNVEKSGGVSLGPLSVSSITATVEMSGRIVDTQSAEILDSFNGYSEKKEASISLDELKGVSFNSNAFSESALGKSIDDALEKIVSSIKVENLQKSLADSKEAEVVKILGDKLIINLGSEDGIEEDQTGEIIRLVKVEDMEDVKMPIGRIKVYSVNNKSSAIVKVLEKEAGENIKKGDIIKFEN